MRCKILNLFRSISNSSNNNVIIQIFGVLKEWILIVLSNVIFPNSTISGLNIIGYGIALCRVMIYSYIKIRMSELTK
ncbi:unnamed protein product [Lathyrus sativus]|nr:unnamed protein product [Lathyrus sativus]